MMFERHFAVALKVVLAINSNSASCIPIDFTGPSLAWFISERGTCSNGQVLAWQAGGRGSDARKVCL